MTMQVGEMPSQNRNVCASVQTQIFRMTTMWGLNSPPGIPGREKRNDYRES